MGWDGLRRFVFHRRRAMPDGQWIRCNSCKNLVDKKAVAERLRVCPECNFHFSISSQERIKLLLDEGTFEEYWSDLAPSDPLNFKALASYKEKIAAAQKQTGLKDAAVVGQGKLKNHDIIFGVTDSRFMMGSMGSVVGEKVTRAAEKARELRIPLVIVSGSGGGARMYEGCISLMQMAKTSAALALLSEAGVLFISVLTHPTMGGVMASFAALGDVIIAEPKCLIGFTGPRIIAQTIKQELPEGFQTSEFFLEHGLVDKIVSRPDLKTELARVIKYCS